MSGYSHADLSRLYAILGDCTSQYRKGEAVQRTETDAMVVTEVFAMPPLSEIGDKVPVDLYYLTVGVDKEKAEGYKQELLQLLDHYPEPDRLAGGPSYIEVGAAIGDQGAAFSLFALGKVLGVWDVITPASFGMTGAQAREAAGSGFIMCTGLKR